MTNEEAIGILKDERWYMCQYSEEYKEAYDMAIEALKESQTTHDQTETQGERMTRIVHELSGWDQGDAESATTTDCISRADIEYHTQLEARGNGQYEEVEVAYKSDIDNLPSVPCESCIWDVCNYNKVDWDTLPSTDREDYEKGYKDGQLAVMTGNDEKEFERGYRMGQAADRPTGEWIEVTNGRGGHECSECHSYAPSYASGDEHLSDFCPNCGAKME